MRDEAMQQFALICAPYPMIDDRNQTPATFEITDLGVWDRKANIESWGWYLAQQASSEADPDFSQVSAYAAPARAEDLTNLSPIYTDVGDVDLFRDDVIDFVKRLQEAGNDVEFHLVPGMFHAGELFNPDATISKTLWQRRFNAITGAFNRG
jgi:acetyl esterase/lipase